MDFPATTKSLRSDYILSSTVQRHRQIQPEGLQRPGDVDRPGRGQPRQPGRLRRLRRPRRGFPDRAAVLPLHPLHGGDQLQ